MISYFSPAWRKYQQLGKILRNFVKKKGEKDIYKHTEK